jgi:stage II sporulation protein D
VFNVLTLKNFRTLLIMAVGLLPISVEGRGTDAVNISVFGLFRPAELVIKPSGSDALTIKTGSETFALEGSSAVRVSARHGGVLWETGGKTGSAPFVEVTGRSSARAQFVLEVPGKIERRFRGSLIVRPAGQALQAVVTMDLETAVASVVAAESPPGAGSAALRAQAVVSRSYFAAARERHGPFDFCDTTHCQYLREPPAANDPAWRAAASTAGLVLSYRAGVLAAPYSRSCGGSTRSLPKAHRGDGYPFYEVPCDYCREHPETWVRRFNESEMRPLLEAQEDSERARIEVVRALGWSAVPSNRFRLEREGQGLTLRGRGVGHGLGLCQKGAAAMAATGVGFQQILSHYFPNTVLRTLPGN